MVELGQTIDIDSQPRSVRLPAAVAGALERDSLAGSAFSKLAFTHQKEFARWVEQAKREETKQSRVERTLQMLREGRTRS